MARSHTPASRASTTPTRTSLDAPLDPEVAAGNSAESLANPAAQTSEGPASAWASEAPPSDRSPGSPAPLGPPGSSPSPRSFRPLRWDDPVDARTWLDRVRSQVADLAALGREGSRLHKHHVLSRAERGRQVHAATTFLQALLGAAEAGLPTPSTEAAEEGDQGE
jgi:hypothetical protein